MRNPDWFNVTHGALLSLALLLGHAPAAFAQNKHTLPLFFSASHQTLQGFVRIINRSERDGEVTIHAIDDTGQRFGPVTLSLKAKATQHFNSDSLRDGDPDKGLSGSIANGEGNWRLEIETNLDIEPLAYSRPKGEGFITSTHDVADGASMRWHVAMFNPGSNADQQSWLRVVNTSGIDTEVTVEGLDDEGSAGAGVVSFDLAGDAARLLSAQELEQGSADSTFDGRLGDGAGKWQLFVSAGRPIQVMSLLLGQSGNLTNLSTVTRDAILRGGPDGDELWGGNGDDIINPGDNSQVDESDRVHASAGDDTILYTDSSENGVQLLWYSDLDAGVTVTIDGAADRATVDKGSAGTDTIVNIANPLNAGGSPPYNGVFELIGTPSNDVFHLALDDGQFMNVGGSAGADTFNIETDMGAVRIDYEDAPAGVEVDLGTGRATDDGFGDVDTINGEVWGVAGSEFSDVLRGSDNNEVFVGRAGNDEIDGGGGVDRLYFGSLSRFAGSFDIRNLEVDLGEGTATGTWNGKAFSYTLSNIEQVRGSTGNDTLRGSVGGDSLDGGPGDDVLNPVDGDGGIEEWDAIDGSAGNDTIVYTESRNPRVWQDLDYVQLDSGITATIDGAGSSSRIDKGSAGRDTVVDVDNPMNGWGLGFHGTHSDDIFNLSVEDGQTLHVRGRAGNDTFIIQSLGNLRINYDDAPAGVDIDLGAGRANDDGYGDVDTIRGDVSELRGSDFKDVIRGSDNDESFIGRGGDDVIDGGGGFDLLRFDRPGVGNLIVDMTDGTATGTWNGRLFNYSFSNIEHVRGGAGFDILVDSEGDDTLEGGGSLDFFLMVDGGNDTIVDFSNDDDDFIFLDSDLVEDFGLTHADVIAAARQDGGDVLIDLSTYGMGTIRLKNFNIDRLTPDDIRL